MCQIQQIYLVDIQFQDMNCGDGILYSGKAKESLCVCTRRVWIFGYLQESRLMERTKEMCTPNRRWEPEHSKQQKAPMGSDPGGAPGGGTMSDAQRGWRSGQSEQT
jgi:hypothetical protein